MIRDHVFHTFRALGSAMPCELDGTFTAIQVSLEKIKSKLPMKVFHLNSQLLDAVCSIANNMYHLSFYQSLRVNVSKLLLDLPPGILPFPSLIF